MKPEDLDLMRKIDELYTDDPSRGSRSIRRQLKRQGILVNRKRIQRLMRIMGIEAVYPKPRTTRRHPGHKVYPYLLRDMTVERSNQVWAADITYRTVVSCTWSSSWTGTAAKSYPGGYPTPWMLTFVLKCSKRP